MTQLYILQIFMPGWTLPFFLPSICCDTLIPLKSVEEIQPHWDMWMGGGQLLLQRLQPTAHTYMIVYTNLTMSCFLKVSCNMESQGISSAILSHIKTHWHTELSFNYACAVSG